VSPPSSIDIAQLFPLVRVVPTNQPTKRREKEKEKKERKKKNLFYFQIFIFFFLQLGPVHTPIPPIGAGWKWSESLVCPQSRAFPGFGTPRYGGILLLGPLDMVAGG